MSDYTLILFNLLLRSGISRQNSFKMHQNKYGNLIIEVDSYTYEVMGELTEEMLINAVVGITARLGIKDGRFT